MPEIIVKLGDSIVQKNIFIKESIRIGRVPDNEVVVENLAVSRYHAVIEYEDDRYILTDLDSSNGTFVNGVRIKKTELQDRDVITIGKHKLYFYDQRGAGEIKPRASVVDIEPTVVPEQQTPPPQAELEIVKGRQKGTRFVINGAQTSIGRGTFNDIQLTDWFVSKVHATIERRNSEFVIRDLGSWRHTYVNGIMVHELPLADGDIIQMGPTVQLSFNLVRQELPLPASARMPDELQPSAAPASQAGSAVEPAEPQGEVTEQETPAVVLKWSPEQIQTQPEEEIGAKATVESEPVMEVAAAENIAASAPEPEAVSPVEPEPAEAAAAEHFDAASALAELEDDLDEHEHVQKPEPAHEALGLDDELDLGEPAKEPETEKPVAEEIKIEAEAESVEKPVAEPRVLASVGAAKERVALDLDMDELDEMPPMNRSTNGSAPAPAQPVPIAAPIPAELVPSAPAKPAAVEPAPEPMAVEPSAQPVVVETPSAPATSPTPSTPAAEKDPEAEIQMWEKALKNKNPIIRKQAARQLQKLTGKQYDYS